MQLESPRDGTIRDPYRRKKNGANALGRVIVPPIVDKINN